MNAGDQEISSRWQVPGVDGFLSAPFSADELTTAICQLKSRKIQGPNNISQEFLINWGPEYQNWCPKFYYCRLTNQAFPKIRRKATVIALPNKTNVEDLKSYHPISLLYVSLCARVEPIVDPQLLNG